MWTRYAVVSMGSKRGGSHPRSVSVPPRRGVCAEPRVGRSRAPARAKLPERRMWRRVQAMGPPLASVPVVEGDREGEGRSFTQTARHPDAASVQLDELPGERQPEPRALDLLRGGTHLPELLEGRLVIFGGDTD